MIHAGSESSPVWLRPILLLFLGLHALGQPQDTFKVHLPDRIFFQDEDSAPLGQIPEPSQDWRSIGARHLPITSGWSWLYVPIELEGQPPNDLMLYLSLSGAAEVYVHKAMQAKMGFSQEGKPVGTNDYLLLHLSPEHLRPLDSGRWQVPLMLHLNTAMLNHGSWQGVRPRLGLLCGSGETLTKNLISHGQSETFRATILAGCGWVLGLLHLLLFLFQPKARADLYYACFCLSLGLNASLQLVAQDVQALDVLILCHRFSDLFSISCFLFGLLQAGYIINQRTTRFHVAFTLVGFSIALIKFWRPFTFGQLFNFLMVATMVEIVRTVIMRMRSPLKNEHLFHSWIIGLGATPLLFSATFIGLSNMGFFPNFLGLTMNATYIGLLSLLLGNSAFLALQFAKTGQKLEQQLLEVQRLSDENLKKEVEKVRLETENQRKDQELEEARQLQLSMLPSKMPHLPGWEIAAAMRTATEVGGDYYDFKFDATQGLLGAIGDATGHGLKAGTMVAAVKSLFMAVAQQRDPAEAMAIASAAVKGVGMKKMFMALTLFRLRESGIHLCGAGMPYPILYRREDGTCRLVELKAPPLGALASFPYRSKMVSMKEGDLLLLMSDGLSECFNDRAQMLGTDPILQVLAENADQAPCEVIDRLLHLGEAWAAGTPLEDDITLLIIKSKSGD